MWGHRQWQWERYALPLRMLGKVTHYLLLTYQWIADLSGVPQDPLPFQPWDHPFKP
ncbi:hypothetical protein F2Q68_00033743 [Brassica cretica]|uniref:Uncharacterized protein n=1 Tax=Brassica cretica TaxID=69181 RepID=A0A3N6PXF0_BRACR|nr:hypothetical protein F2Q68_00033743 [Brassica cretica]